MLSRFRKIREPYRMFLIGFATLGVMAAGHAWPNYAYPIWGVFLAFLAVTLYEDLAEPVNYDSIRFLDEAIEYKASGQTYLIRYDEIGRLEYVREYDDYPNEIESKWMVHFAEGTGPHLYKRQGILNEWPDSRKLLRAFEKNLPGFDKMAARKGRRAWREGRWLCYTAAPREQTTQSEAS